MRWLSCAGASRARRGHATCCAGRVGVRATGATGIGGEGTFTVAGVGGNAGTQTLAVTVRAIATNQLTGSNHWRAVWREIRVALMNGLTIAVLIGLGVTLFLGSSQLGLVIAAAMLTNIVIAGLAGVLVTLGLERAGADPAVAPPQAGPVVLKAPYAQQFEARRQADAEATKRGEPPVSDAVLCSPYGMPRMMAVASYPVEFLQTAGQITIVTEAAICSTAKNPLLSCSTPLARVFL